MLYCSNSQWFVVPMPVIIALDSYAWEIKSLWFSAIYYINS